MTTDQPTRTLVDVPEEIVERLRRQLEFLYPPDGAEWALGRLCGLIEEGRRLHAQRVTRGTLFDQTDAVLITYGDQLTEPGRSPLSTLADFCHLWLRGLVSTVHLLPFHPWTSDEGFAVADFDTIDPALGSWEDLARFRPEFRLMLDAVANHVSASHPWVRAWLQGDPAYEGFVKTAEEHADLSTVVRPRTTPLLTPFMREDGQGDRTVHVWTTFSADQVDVDYSRPEVLVAMTEVLLRYLEHGADIIRLDAVGFLWKEPGSPCIHEPQTHAIVKVWRAFVDAVSPETLLVTETNVPQQENVAYFGNGHDEAHLVYQFPLSPLVLHAFDRQDTTVLTGWAQEVRPPSDRAAFLNLLGSHDGIGLRPAEGILGDEDIDRLVQRVRRHGGAVSMRSSAGGGERPYELNTVYFDALSDPDGDEPIELQVDRFCAAQAILLALAGVPAVYVQALLGSRNWLHGPKRSGILRSINRERFDRAWLEAALRDPGTLRRRVFDRFARMLRVRSREPAFHPNAMQRVISADPGLFVVLRQDAAGGSVLCAHNVTAEPRDLVVSPADGVPSAPGWLGLLSGVHVPSDGNGVLRCPVPAHGVRWLRAQR